jgi:hypothetical protein
MCRRAFLCLQVRVSDTMFKDGIGLNGLHLGVKNDRFEFNYDAVSFFLCSDA